MSCWDFWDVVYCINLDKRPDRWAQCVEEFTKVDLLEKVERFPAVEHMVGSVGCYISHLEIMRRALRENLNILILEDDVTFLRDGIEALPSAVEELKKVPWDAFFLGMRTNCVLPYRGGLAVLAGVGQAHAYCYSKEFLPMIVALYEYQHEKNNAPFYCQAIDQIGVFADTKRYRVFCVNPIAAVQRKSYSDLHKCEIDYSQTAIDEFHQSLNTKPYPRIYRLLTERQAWVFTDDSPEWRVDLGDSAATVGLQGQFEILNRVESEYPAEQHFRNDRHFLQVLHR